MSTLARTFAVLGLTVLSGAVLYAWNPDRSAAARPVESPATRHVWILFTDKGPIDLAQAVRDLERTYHPRAIERRRLRRTAPGLFDERDLPVHAGYVEAVAQTGAEVHVTSKWVNGVSALATGAQVRTITALPFVSEVQPVRRTRPVPIRGNPTDIDPPARGAAARAGSFYGLSQEQLAQINVIAMHEKGFTGAGVIIGVLDTGFKTTHDAFTHADHPLQVVAEYDFVNNDPEAGPEPGDHPEQHHHGTQVLGTNGAYNPGVLVGSAYDASYILAKVEDLLIEDVTEEPLFVAGLEFIEANGGDVATSSVVIYDHYPQSALDGLTSIMTIGINTATANGVHCCQGAGNLGHDGDPATSTLIPPADGFQAITVGSVDSTGASAWFTSDGPTADGRVKPEVLARGVLTRTVHPDVDDAYQEVNGASFATPTTAGAVACLVQAHPEWTVDQVRWALTHTAEDFVAHGTFDPLYVRGYGICDVLAASGSAPPKPGDLDADGTVGVNDFLLLLAAWGPCPDPCPPHCFGDVDTDCTVGVNDFLRLLAHWG